MFNKNAGQREHLTFRQILYRLMIYTSFAILGANIGASVVQTPLIYFTLGKLGIDTASNLIINAAVMIISVSALYIFLIRRKIYRSAATVIYVPYVIAVLIFGITKYLMV